VPFPKELAAIFVITGENTSQTSCQGICELNLAKIFGIWNMNFIFKGRQID